MIKYCVLWLLVLLVALPWQARAQGAAWSAPVEVSTNAPFSWFPDLAVGSDGTVHIIWASGDADAQAPRDGTKAIDLLRYREFRDGAWSETNDILFTGIGGYTVRNSVTSGKDGRIYVLVRMHTQVYITSALATDAWSARSWSKPQIVSGDVAYYTALAIDNTNTIHAFWSEAKQPINDLDCSTCSDLLYRRSSDGGLTWTEPQNLSYTPVGENRPQVAIDAQDRIHIVWDQGADWYAGAGKPEIGVYRRSDNGGQTWSQPIRFTGGGRPVQQTSLAIDNVGNPIVVFRDAVSDRLYFQFSLDGGNSWGAVGEIPGVRGRSLNDNNLDTYALEADSAGRVHLLMTGFVAGNESIQANPSLLHLWWDGSQWSAPATVMGNELFPEWPRLEVARGNQLHAVWFTRHASDRYRSEDGANYQVWYSTLRLDTPELPPLPLFTTVPTAVGTVVSPVQSTPARQTPTPTSLPVSARQGLPPEGPPAWELQGVQLIAIALLPAIAFLGVVTLIIMRRRH